MVKPPQLALLYSPGSRGDFLVGVLLDRLAPSYQQMRINLSECYRKIHTVAGSRFESEYTVDPAEIKPLATSIRIKLATTDDLLTVAYFWAVKGLHWQPDIDLMLDYLIYQELLFRQYDSEFMHVVKFDQLFDIKQLDQLYYTINGRAIDPVARDCICYNIALHPRVNLSNYTEYFPTLRLSLWSSALEKISGSR